MHLVIFPPRYDYCGAADMPGLAIYALLGTERLVNRFDVECQNDDFFFKF